MEALNLNLFSRCRLVLLLCLVLNTGYAWGCTCQTMPPEVALQNATAVFQGRVVFIVPGPGPGTRATTFKIEKGYKGISGALVTLRHNTVGASCGVQFSLGQRALIYAYGTSSGALTTNMCSGLTSGTAQDRARVLGAGWTPTALQFWGAFAFFLLRHLVVLFILGVALWLLFISAKREFLRRYRYAIGADEDATNT